MEGVEDELFIFLWHFCDMLVLGCVLIYQYFYISLQCEYSSAMYIDEESVLTKINTVNWSVYIITHSHLLKLNNP